MPTITPAARLRALLDQGGLAMPGSFNGLCARAVAQAGFQATYVSGAATSVCAGVPDVGLLTLEHFCRVIREVYDSSSLPLIADADTGFGEAEMVRRTVIEYARAAQRAFTLKTSSSPSAAATSTAKPSFLSTTWWRRYSGPSEPLLRWGGPMRPTVP
ncbi:MAG: isocitrate lyase/phosphoenolpyruvate mutase family protein [Phycisphaerales bacterium]